MKNRQQDYWTIVWQQYRRSWTGVLALWFVVVFSVLGLYAPLLASSKPLFVVYDGTWYFPLFRYLFYQGFFTKRLDLFYNLLMVIAPLWLIGHWCLPLWRRQIAAAAVVLQFGLFLLLVFQTPQDPASDPSLNTARQKAIQLRGNGSSDAGPMTWELELRYMTDYAKLNLVLRDWLYEQQNARLAKYQPAYAVEEEIEWLSEAIARKRVELTGAGTAAEDLPDRAELEKMVRAEVDPAELTWRLSLPTLWQVQMGNERREAKMHLERIAKALPEQDAEAEADLRYIQDRRSWMEAEKQKLSWVMMPLVRWFHWQDDAGGEQDVNRFVDWWELTRSNRKDLVAGLIFGIRISLVVGITAIALALIIGVPIGALAGYYGGRTDIIVMRLIEIWESMPSFFMLLMVVAVTQSKSIFLVISVIGIFGWTGFSRFIRGEFLKQRNLPYVDACRSMGFNDRRIVFRHILPNAVPPLLTLLPFAVMGAITSEAGLSFLGLGEEGSCSWGVLMDEGRAAFPGESYLLWPPAIMLTMLLVAIALMGDAVRDALDPKMRRG